MDYYGAIEAGGTKFICSVASGPDDYVEELRIPTTDPETTIGACIGFFTEMAKKYPLKAIGAASFGPIDPTPTSPTYGYITSTPKPGWGNTDLIGPLQRALGLPCGFDTDVNGAALAEFRWGNPEGVRSLAYYTFGTGVGAGVIVNGQPIHGMLHPEAGHVPIVRDPALDPYGGHCPYHGTCLEGLCNGPSIKARFGIPAEDIPEGHPFWPVYADYVAQACVQQVLITSVEKIVLGGGVMHKRFLFPLIREAVVRRLNGYIQTAQILERIDSYIVPPALGDRSGALGAIALAMGAA